MTSSGAPRRADSVVRVGDTLRRPRHERSEFVAEVLDHLRTRGFEGAPLALGFDERGRQVFEWIDGRVPSAAPFLLDDDQLVAAARLLRRLHDTASSLPGLDPGRTVCHGDLGPHNTVFRAGTPVAIIDWDEDVRPGCAADDFAHAVWGYADLLEPTVAVDRQRHGLTLMCREYGVLPTTVLDELAARFHRAADDHRAGGRPRAEAVFQQLLDRLEAGREALLEDDRLRRWGRAATGRGPGG